MKDTALKHTVKAAQAGDAGAFEALFRAHKDSVYSLAMHFLGDPEVAADVTQETFVRAWERLPKLREAAAFDGWLKSTAMNLVRDHYRGSRPQDTLDEDDPLPGDEEGPDETAERAEQEQRVREAVMSLPEHQRDVVIMHYLEGRPVLEIMEALQLPKGTIVSRLSRGREHLRRRLASYIESGGEG